MTKQLYSQSLGPLVAEKTQWWAIAVFYPLHAVALTHLIVLPAHANKQGLIKTFASGALFGLAAYGTYDLTNQAIIRNWPLIITIVDMLWGTILTKTGNVIAVTLFRLHFSTMRTHES